MPPGRRGQGSRHPRKSEEHKLILSHQHRCLRSRGNGARLQSTCGAQSRGSSCSVAPTLRILRDARYTYECKRCPHEDSPRELALGLEAGGGGGHGPCGTPEMPTPEKNGEAVSQPPCLFEHWATQGVTATTALTTASTPHAWPLRGHLQAHKAQAAQENTNMAWGPHAHDNLCAWLVFCFTGSAGNQNKNTQRAHMANMPGLYARRLDHSPPRLTYLKVLTKTPPHTECLAVFSSLAIAAARPRAIVCERSSHIAAARTRAIVR